MSKSEHLVIKDQYIKVFTEYPEKLELLKEYIEQLLVISELIDYDVKIVNSSKFDDIMFVKDSNQLGIHFRHTFNIGKKNNTKIYCTHNDDVVSLVQLKTLF